MTIYPLVNHFFKFPSKISSKMRLTVSLSDAYTGATIHSQITRNVKCNKCDGSGAFSKEHKHSCPQCNGKGQYKTNVRVGPFVYQDVATCPRCHGSGVEITKHCDVCHGKGKVQETQSIDIKIPKGSKTGDQVVIPHMGEMGGDLLVILTVNNIEGNFRRNGYNLVTEITLSLKESLLGFSRELEHIDGRIIKYTSQKITADGDTIILKGEGMRRSWFRNGNCLLKVRVNVEDLSKEQIKEVSRILGE
ncbi:Chaperone proteinDNAJ [Entamoeba marina]